LAHDDLEFAAAVNDADITAFADLLSHGFGFPPADAKPWFERAGTENLRLLKRGAHVVGGLLEIPMGQYFGGRSVSTMGVAGVGIAPEERGRGVAAHLMLAMLREARARGFALSTLYPAAIALYRSVGYERAGARFSVTVDPNTCDIARVPEMKLAEVVGTPDDVVALYDAVARRCPGYLERGPYVWSRVSRPRGLLPKTFTVRHEGALEGYVALAHTSAGSSPTTVSVTDLAATTARAARAILRLLVEYRSLVGQIVWHGGTSDIFTNLLPERHAEVKLVEYFMVRIVDVGRALTMRGWPPAASGSLTFVLSDTTMPENSGPHSVTLEDGRATLHAEPRGARVLISERGLAALYTGQVQPHVLADLGWLESDESGRAQLEAWFSGPQPTMRDFF
jgi:predicted acetyltransferase